MLKVQEFLNKFESNGLEKLIEHFEINVKFDSKLNVVCLNYDQINSPLGEEIVQECRSLILENLTWKVKSYPFKKFFNYGEYHTPNNFNWNNFKTYDKLDGSIITFWHHDVFGWQISTRSVPDGNTPFSSDSKSFATLVKDTLKEMGTSFEELTSYLKSNYCYTFELTSPENQIVVYYPIRNLSLLALRNLDTLEEEDPIVWIDINKVPVLQAAKSYDKLSLEQIQERVNALNPREHEGFVLVDSDWNRIKIKSEAYCLISHSRDSLSKSNKTRLQLILTEKEDDVLPILPKFVQDKIIEMKYQVISLQHTIEDKYSEIMHISDQKEFAKEAIKTKYSSILFLMRKTGLTANELIKQQNPKSILSFLNLREEE